MAIEIRRPARSSYRQFRYECPAGTVTKCYQWSDVTEITCACCGGEASRLLDQRTAFAQQITPMSYAVNPATGHVWVPGRAGKKPPKGYVAKEVRTWRDRDAFYKEARQQADTAHDDYQMRHELEFGALIDDGRSRLRDYLAQDHIPEIDRKTNQPTGRMVRLTEEGRGLIRHALAQPGYEAPRWAGAEASIESWEMDRATYTDRNTDWHRREA